MLSVSFQICGRTLFSRSLPHSTGLPRTSSFSQQHLVLCAGLAWWPAFLLHGENRHQRKGISVSSPSSHPPTCLCVWPVLVILEPPPLTEFCPQIPPPLSYSEPLPQHFPSFLLRQVFYLKWKTYFFLTVIIHAVPSPIMGIHKKELS